MKQNKAKTNLFLILEPSGIFVKSITKSSAVEHDGRIQIGDQIIAVSTHLITALLIFMVVRCILLVHAVLRTTGSSVLIEACFGGLSCHHNYSLFCGSQSIGEKLYWYLF